MRKNGFISISIIYSLFFVFMLLMLLIMANYSVNRVKLDVYKKDIKVDYSTVDLESPHCFLEITSLIDGATGNISATDDKSGLNGDSNYTFEKLKENKTYTFTDNQGNTSSCTVIVSNPKTVTRYKTRIWSDPKNCKGTCKSYNEECGKPYVEKSTCMYARDSEGKCSGGGPQWDCTVDWPTIDGKQNPCYSGNPSKTSKCYCVGWKRDCKKGSCKEYNYNVSCGDTYESCLEKESSNCDSGWSNYSSFSDWKEETCENTNSKYCETGIMYSAFLEEL